MYRFKTNDRVTGDTAKDFLLSLKNSNMFTQEQTYEEYKSTLRKRLSLTLGKIITNDEKAIIDALIESGLIITNQM